MPAPSRSVEFKFFLRRHHLTSIAVFVLALAATLGFAWNHQRTNQARVHEATRAEVLRVSSLVERRLQQYTFGLRGARGAVNAVGWDHYSRSAHLRYFKSRIIDEEFPGARGVGLIRRIPRDTEAAYIDRATRDGWPAFSIRQLTPHDDDRFVIQYIEPVQRNREAVGLDIASEEIRRTAALRALRSGEAALTRPITLVQATGQPKAGFLLLLPIYKNEAPTNNEEQREAAGLGWTYSPLLISEVLEGLDFNPKTFQLLISDVDSNSVETFYASPEFSSGIATIATSVVNRPVAGRIWRVRLQASSQLVNTLGLLDPRWTVLLGTLLSALLAFATATSLGARQQAKALLRERERRAGVAQSITDAVMILDRQGVLVDWNKGGEDLFGYRPDEVIGRTVFDVLSPADLRGEAVASFQTCMDGDNAATHETQRLHRDGTRIDVSIVRIPLRAEDGQIEGVAISMRDIRASKAAEREIRRANTELEQRVEARTRELESARHMLRMVLDSVPTLIGYWDQDLHNRVANHAYRTWFNIDPQALYGQHMRELVGDTGFEKVRPLVEAALRGEPQTFEQEIRRPDGGIRHALTHYVPDIQDGVVQGFYATLHEITDIVEGRARLNAALRESESLLHAVFSHAIVSVSDRHGRIIEINDAFCRISGYRREELIGQDHRILSSGRHPAEFWASARACFEGGQPWRGEICNRSKDGNYYWVDSMIAPILNGNHEVDRYISIRFDITAAKSAQERLQAREDLLERTGRAAHVGGWELDLLARDLTWTPEVRRILDLPGDYEPTPEGALQFYDPEHRETVLESMRSSIVDRRDWDIELPVTTATGRRIQIRLTGTSLSKDDTVVRLYGAIQDISEKKSFEQGLQEARWRAESANRAKSEFLANMSHEIRTPLNAVQGLVYLLRQTRLDDAQRLLLDRVQLGGSALLQIINDVLDLSKVEAGEMTLERTPFDLVRVTREVVDLMEVQAQSKFLPMTLELVEPLPKCVYGDPTRVAQILTNILSNAIKFTDQGEVSAQLSWTGSSELRGTARLVVRDSGIGMSDETIARVFQPFVQADSSTTRRFGGTGLGLAIVKRLLDLMGGHLSVTSSPGEGSTFEVTVDLDIADSKLAVPRLPDVIGRDFLAGRTVLVVDDSDINRDVARRILEHRGAHVLLAEDGAQAIDVLRERGEVDLVLLDLHMPVMDGFEAASRIRRDLGLSELPLIALTAGATLTERKAAEAAGCNDFLTKPFDPTRLLLTIERLLRGINARAANVATESHSDPARPASTVRPVGQAARAATAATTAVSSADTDSAPDGWPQVEGVDIGGARERFSNELPLYQRMLNRFFAELPDNSIPADVGAERRRELIAKAHAIRGNAGTLGFTHAHLLAGELEESLKEADTESARVYGQALDVEWRRLRTAFTPWLTSHETSRRASEMPSAMPADAELLSTLCQLLDRFNPRAVKYFGQHANRFESMLGAQAFAALSADMAALRFKQALDRLNLVAQA